MYSIVCTVKRRQSDVSNRVCLVLDFQVWEGSNQLNDTVASAIMLNIVSVFLVLVCSCGSKVVLETWKEINK
jgi:hypothetical protein